MVDGEVKRDTGQVFTDIVVGMRVGVPAEDPIGADAVFGTVKRKAVVK